MATVRLSGHAVVGIERKMKFVPTHSSGGQRVGASLVAKAIAASPVGGR